MLVPTLLLQCSLNNAANEKLKGMLSFSFSYCVTRGRFTPFCKTARWKKQYREHTPTMGNTLNTDLHRKCHLVLSLGNKHIVMKRHSSQREPGREVASPSWALKDITHDTGTAVYSHFSSLRCFYMLLARCSVLLPLVLRLRVLEKNKLLNWTGSSDP